MKTQTTNPTATSTAVNVEEKNNYIYILCYDGDGINANIKTIKSDSGLKFGYGNYNNEKKVWNKGESVKLNVNDIIYISNNLEEFETYINNNSQYKNIILNHD